MFKVMMYGINPPDKHIDYISQEIVTPTKINELEIIESQLKEQIEEIKNIESKLTMKDDITVNNYYHETILVIEKDKIDLTWFEIQAIRRRKDDKIISKNLLICQGSTENPSTIFLTKKEAVQLIENLKNSIHELE